LDHASPPASTGTQTGNRAIGRHPFDDLHGIAPAQIAGKMHGPGAAVAAHGGTIGIPGGGALLHGHCLLPP
jgi:hypothetical protein